MLHYIYICMHIYVFGVNIVTIVPNIIMYIQICVYTHTRIYVQIYKCPQTGYFASSFNLHLYKV